jgi:lysozyme
MRPVRNVGVLMSFLSLLLLIGCSERPDRRRAAAASAPQEFTETRTPASHFRAAYPETRQAVTGDLSAGVPAAALSPLSSQRREALTPLIDALALSENIDPLLVHAVISQESRYNPRALSPVGAGGLMQMMPGTAARFGLTSAERFEPHKNIRAGIRYLKVLTRLFGGHLDLILAGYNAGEGAVLKYGRQIPPYKETQQYVRRVKGYYALYREQARHRQLRTMMAQVEESRRRVRAPTRQTGRSDSITSERATGAESP